MFTIQEVANKFKVTPRTVRRWINLGIFPRPLKIGGTIRYRQADLDQFTASGFLDGPARPVVGGWLPCQGDLPSEQLAEDGDLDKQLAECAKTAKDFFEKQGMTADAQADGK